MNDSKKRVLAVCSGGGHWVQMKRLSPAMEGNLVNYATVLPADQSNMIAGELYGIPDGNQDTKLRLIYMAICIAWIFVRVRPHVVVSTGAAPGYFAMRFGKWFGAKTVFIDSIANAEQLSLAAQLSLPHVDSLLSQWKEVAEKHGLKYEGSVI